MTRDYETPDGRQFRLVVSYRKEHYRSKRWMVRIYEKIEPGIEIQFHVHLCGSEVQATDFMTDWITTVEQVTVGSLEFEFFRRMGSSRSSG